MITLPPVLYVNKDILYQIIYVFNVTIVNVLLAKMRLIIVLKLVMRVVKSVISPKNVHLVMMDIF